MPYGAYASSIFSTSWGPLPLLFQVPWRRWKESWTFSAFLSSPLSLPLEAEPLRDTLIGYTPVTWMQNPVYVYLIGVVTILAIIFRNKIDYLKKSLFLFDTIGLGIFTITGVEIGIRNELDPIIVIALGTMTGTFGGVIRDILM